MNATVEIGDVRVYAAKLLERFHARQAENLTQIFNERDLLLERIACDLEDLPTLTLGEVVRLESARALQKSADFADTVKDLAVYICASAFGGRKSSADGIDLEFERDGTYYIVAIKSGPNWGNSRQISKMRDDFNKAKRILRTNAARRNIIEPIGREARMPNEEVELLYAGLVNKLTGEVVNQFCDANGLIDWPALVRFNSGRTTQR